MEQKEEIDTLFKKIKHANADSIHIARVPKDIKAQFIDLANEQFMGDYGVTLTFIMKGMVNPDLNVLYAQLDELNSRVTYLEQNQNKSSESKVTKTLSGRVIKNG